MSNLNRILHDFSHEHHRYYLSNPLSALEESLRMAGMLFSDPFFPSLPFADQEDRHHDLLTMSWMRASDMCPRPVLYGPDSDCVFRRGVFSNDALISIFSSLQKNPQAPLSSLLGPVSVSGSLSEHGLYCIRLYWKGVPVFVIVDDTLLVDSMGNIAFSYGYRHTSDSEHIELWPALVEKALIKFFNSFTCLSGSKLDYLCQMLTIFSGFESYHIDIDAKKSKELWQELLRLQEMNCSFVVQSHCRTHSRTDTISTHRFSPGEYVSIEGFKKCSSSDQDVIVIKKCLAVEDGEDKELGCFSNSKLMPDLLESNSSTSLTDVAVQLNHISFETFCQNFWRIFVARPLDAILIFQETLTLSGPMNGGRSSCRTFFQNPQFMICIEEPTELLISNIFDDEGVDAVASEELPQIYLFSHDGDKRLTSWGQFIEKSHCTNIRGKFQIAQYSCLHPGKYVLIATSESSEISIKLNIKVFSPHPWSTSCRPIDPNLSWNVSSVSGWFLHSNAQSSDATIPQYRIRPSQSCLIMFRLRPCEDLKIGMQLCLFRSKGYVYNLSDHSLLWNCSSYLRTRELDFAVEYEPSEFPNGFVVAVRNEYTEKADRFELEIACTVNYEIQLVDIDPEFVSLKYRVHSDIDLNNLDSLPFSSIYETYSSIGGVAFFEDPVPQLLNLCQSRSVMFVDPRFPPIFEKIIRPDISDSQEYLEVSKWLRCSDVYAHGDIFLGDLSSSKVQQGQLGDCWMLATFESLATTMPEIMIDKIYPAHRNEFGIYSIKFFIEDRWMYVVVDDFIPVNESGKPVFARSCDGEYWPLLLEKGQAKLLGAYQALRGSYKNILHPPNRPTDDILLFRDLSGGEGFANLHDAWKSMDCKRIWELLHRFRHSRCVLTTSCSPTMENDNLEARDLNLMTNHRYAIIDLCEFPGLEEDTSEYIRLLCLKNVHSRVVWKGDWSVSSALWNSHDWIRDQLHPQDLDEGTFWMDLDDYLKYFCGIVIGYTFLDYSKFFFSLILGSENALHGINGGHTSKLTWFLNPQYRIIVEEPCELFVNFRNRDYRFVEEDRLPKQIQLRLYENPNRDVFITSMHRMVNHSFYSYTLSRQFTATWFNINPGTYSLFCCAGDFEQDARVMHLIACSQPNVHVEQIILPWKYVKVQGSFSDFAGGYKSILNPWFLFRFVGKGHVLFRLLRDGNEEVGARIFACFQEDIPSNKDDLNLGLRSEYLRTKDLSFSLQFDSDISDHCYIMICLQTPRLSDNFELWAFSCDLNSFTLKPIS